MTTTPEAIEADRLRAVASLVPPGSRVAEIGTDHGLLPERLLRSGRASHCIATERDARGLVRARARLADPSCAGRAELRNGDGLGPLRRADRVDVLVLAGLGARKIRRLLESRDPRRLGIRRLVLQPQTAAGPLRRWLVEHGWRVVDERLVEERGRHYAVIAAERGAGGCAPEHPGLPLADLLEAGPMLVGSGDPLVRRHWEGRLSRIEAALGRARSPGARARLERRREQAARILAALRASAGRV